MTRNRVGRRCHVVHDESGQILALALTAIEEGAGGVRLSVRPVPRPGQYAIEVELGREQDGLDLHEILATFVVERRDPGAATLRRRATGA
jgi:hypothetical protein